MNDGVFDRGRMNRPEILDLFCCAGGSAVGLYRAGFNVTGVDIKPQPHYPCFHDADYASHFKFYQADALTFPLDGYDAYWASPPCQFASEMRKGRWQNRKHPNLIPSIRERLKATGRPYIIENVSGAKSYLDNPVMLCGSMFGLGAESFYHCGCGYDFEYDLGKYGCPNCEGGKIARLKYRYQLRRHRLFESNILLFAPTHCNHQGQPVPVYGHAGGKSKRDGLTFPGTDAWREAMGIDWMTGKELSQAIPPAYSEYIGKRLMEAARRALEAQEKP